MISKMDERWKWKNINNEEGKKRYIGSLIMNYEEKLKSKGSVVE